MPRNPALRATALAGCCALACARPAEPGEMLGRRVSVGGELSGTIAPEDEGYFNYGDYETSQLRLFRASLAAEVRLGGAAALLAELRSDNLQLPRFYALYLRLAPWRGRALALQAGLVPPVFGAFPRRRYGADNPLPSFPLAFQYLTALRADALPARVEDLLAQRGRGWRVRYPVGSPEPAPGLPLVQADRWDAGLQLRVGSEPVSLAVALTQGSPGHPRLRDDNDGKQLSARLQWRPSPALTAGVSAASGEFLAREAKEALPAAVQRSYRQQAAGLDLEWQAGYWIVRAEAVFSRWELPALEATPITAPLAALGGYAEARYKIRPGLYAAARVERLGFAQVDSSLGRRAWEAPVTRIEAGGGWTPRRRVLLKASWQHNRRDGGRVRSNHLLAGQVSLWF